MDPIPDPPEPRRGDDALIAVLTTVAREDDARSIAQAAVGRGLAACVQWEAIESVYVWEGAVQQAREVRLMFKTAADGYAALERLILELHPYELPAVYALPVGDAHAPYAQWVRDHSSGAAGPGWPA